jgi:hypothetical protein
VSNLGGEPRAVRVSERYPVSEIERVEITLLSSKGAVRDERDGFAHFDVELGPRSTTELELAYRIEAASNVVLPF